MLHPPPPLPDGYSDFNAGPTQAQMWQASAPHNGGLSRARGEESIKDTRRRENVFVPRGLWVRA